MSKEASPRISALELEGLMFKLLSEPDSVDAGPLVVLMGSMKTRLERFGIKNIAYVLLLMKEIGIVFQVGAARGTSWNLVQDRPTVQALIQARYAQAVKNVDRHLEESKALLDKKRQFEFCKGSFLQIAEIIARVQVDLAKGD